MSQFSEIARTKTFLKIKSRGSLGNLKHFYGVPYTVSFIHLTPAAAVYSTQHALRLATWQYSVDSVRMTDRHLFTAAEGKYAEGTRRNCVVAMLVGHKTNKTHCIIIYII